MEKNGLISVIIPVYNVEKYLQECVDSVLSQTYENYEIILIDDGSTDSSGAICDEFAVGNEKIKVIHKENGGLSHARNTGLSLAQGEYIYFLDSDDYLDDNAFSLMLERIEKENADFLFFDAHSFNDEGRDFNIPQNYIRKKHYVSSKGIEMLAELYKNKDFHSAVQLFFFRKSFLQKENLTFLNGAVYEDVLYAYQAFCKAECVAHINCPIYFRRYRENSIMTSHKNIHHFESIVRIFGELNLFSSTEYSELLAVQKSYLSRCAFNIFNVYEKLSSKDKKIFRNTLDTAKKIIQSNDFYENKALKMRCKGKAFWVVYKVIEKIIG